MFDIAAIAGKVAGIVALVAFVPYIISILRGKTKPNRASWFIWSLVGVMMAASYHFSGAIHTIWVTISYVIGPVVVFVLSIKYGKDGWTLLDRFCLFCAGISLFAWWASGSPLTALLINIFIDAMGNIPTIKKAYLEPETEDKTAWGISFSSGVINLFAIECWTFAISVYPIYVMLGNGLVFALVITGHIRQKRLDKKTE